LRHCATSRKVAGLIPDGVIGIFYWHNPSGRTMALELTQPLTEMSTRNISWGVKAAGVWADNLTTFMWRLSWNLGASTFWNPSGPVRACNGTALPFSPLKRIKIPTYSGHVERASLSPVKCLENWRSLDTLQNKSCLLFSLVFWIIKCKTEENLAFTCSYNCNVCCINVCFISISVMNS
jgi:hypothetical protein